MVDGMARSEYDGSVVQYIDPLRTKFSCRNTLHTNEGVKYQFYVVLLCNVEVW